MSEREDTIALAQSGGELHPVIGLWPVALMQDLEEQLQAGVRKVLHWTDRHGTVAVAVSLSRFCGLSIDPFYNANTPQELDELRAMLHKTLVMKPGAAVHPGDRHRRLEEVRQDDAGHAPDRGAD